MVLLTPSRPASSRARFPPLLPLAPIFPGSVFLQFLKVLLIPELESNTRYGLRGGLGYSLVPNPTLQGATVNFKKSGRF